MRHHFLIRRVKLRASLADPCGRPHFVRKPRHCSGNHSRRPAASARIRGGTSQTRWPAADSASLANRDRSIGEERDGRSPRVSGIPAEPSFEVSSAADEVAITRSTLERRKIDREIEENEDWFRERQRQQAAAEAVERQRIEAQEAEQRRLEWEQKWTQYALNSVPYNARREVEMEVHTMVSEALSVLQPSQPEAITQRLVDAAVHRALGPWTRKQGIERTLKAGMSSLAWEIQFRAEYGPLKQRAWDAAVAALRKVREEASYGEMETAAAQAVQPMIREYEHHQACQRILGAYTSSMRRGKKRQLPKKGCGKPWRRCPSVPHKCS